MYEYKIIHRDQGDTVTDVTIIERKIRTLVDQDTGDEVEHRGPKTRRAFAPGDYLPDDVTVAEATADQMAAAHTAIAHAARAWLESRGVRLADIDTVAAIKSAQDLADAERAAKESLRDERDEQRDRADAAESLATERAATLAEKQARIDELEAQQTTQPITGQDPVVGFNK